MIRTRVTAGAVVVLTGLSGVVATPAEAAPPGWRQTTTIPGNPQFMGLAALSANNAWAIGMPLKVLRWNGRSWRNVTLPASFKGESLWHISASARDNVWIVGLDQFGENTGWQLLRWNGTAWSRPLKAPTRSQATALVTRGPKDVWYFTEDNRAHHYNGRTWRTINLGWRVRKAVAAGSQVWAVGNAGAQGVRAARWNGSVWRTTRVPVLGRSGLEDVTIVNSRTAWAVGYVGNSPLVLRWNGSRWSRFTTTGGRAAYFTGVAYDGDRGLWLAAYRDGVHHLVGGRLTKARVANVRPHRAPLMFAALARVPGTRSVWGVGGHREPERYLDAGIFKYGR